MKTAILTFIFTPVKQKEYQTGKVTKDETCNDNNFRNNVVGNPSFHFPFLPTSLAFANATAIFIVFIIVTSMRLFIWPGVIFPRRKGYRACY